MASNEMIGNRYCDIDDDSIKENGREMISENINVVNMKTAMKENSINKWY